MHDENSLLGLVMGGLAFAVGLGLVIRNAGRVAKGELVPGTIVDRKSNGQEHFVPVIEYTFHGQSFLYTSSHYSVWQKIGRKIHLVRSKKDGGIIGTLGSLFFLPVLVMLSGVFILVTIILFEIS